MTIVFILLLYLCSLVCIGGNVMICVSLLSTLPSIYVMGRKDGCDARNVAWYLLWPMELGTPVRAKVPRRAPPKIGRGVKGSSVCVTRPVLFRPQTGSRSRRRVTGFPSEPYPLAATNGQRKQERRRRGGGGCRRCDADADADTAV